MKKFNNNFDEWRKWFNRNFSLQVNGKFKGLSTLLSLVGSLYFERFTIKLASAYAKLVDGYRSKCSDLRIKLHGYSLVIRFR